MAVNKQLWASLWRVARMWNPVRKINSEWTKEAHEEKLNDAKSKLYSINHSTMPYNKREQQRAYYKDIINTEKPAAKYWKGQTRKEVKALDNLNKERPAKKWKRKFTKFLDLNSLQ